MSPPREGTWSTSSWLPVRPNPRCRGRSRLPPAWPASRGSTPGTTSSAREPADRAPLRPGDAEPRNLARRDVPVDDRREDRHRERRRRDPDEPHAEHDRTGGQCSPTRTNEVDRPRRRYPRFSPCKTPRHVDEALEDEVDHQDQGRDSDGEHQCWLRAEPRGAKITRMAPIRSWSGRKKNQTATAFPTCTRLSW